MTLHFPLMQHCMYSKRSKQKSLEKGSMIYRRSYFRLKWPRKPNLPHQPIITRSLSVYINVINDASPPRTGNCHHRRYCFFKSNRENGRQAKVSKLETLASVRDHEYKSATRCGSNGRLSPNGGNGDCQKIRHLRKGQKKSLGRNRSLTF